MADDSTSAKPTLESRMQTVFTAWWGHEDLTAEAQAHWETFKAGSSAGAQVALSPSVSEAEADAAFHGPRVPGCLECDDCDYACNVHTFSAFLRARADALGVKQE